MDGLPIKVAIASAYGLIREGLKAILQKEGSVELVGEAVNGAQAFTVVKKCKPSVLLMDISTPEMNGPDDIRAIREANSETKVIIVSGSMDHGMIFKCLKAGAKGCVSNDVTSEHLLKAIQTVKEGELWVQRKMMAAFFEDVGSYPLHHDEGETKRTDLTPREREVLSFLTTGCTNKEIGDKLFISEKTVKAHVNSIFRKLHVTRRLQAILYAIHQSNK
jgi:two-component system, NarL family, response regulator DegU